MSINTCEAKLTKLTRNLSRQFEDVSLVWQDDKRNEFYRDYVAPLFSSAGVARSFIGQLDEALTTIRKDCE